MAYPASLGYRSSSLMAISGPPPYPIPDAESGWIERLPPRWRPYARLARLDRPAGMWLLYWPCLWGFGAAGALPAEWGKALLFLLGAIAMRGAGCVWNDIVDRDLDRQVARTATRPLAAGAVSRPRALLFMGVLALTGLGVLLTLSAFAQVVAVSSLVLVALYPFMKRITWWPQAWLGLTFNWGALVGYVEGRGTIDSAALFLYAAGIAWTLGYDTIYALQDIEDDALAGVKSSARALGDRLAAGVRIFYVLAASLLAAALVVGKPTWTPLLFAGPFALHLGWQARRLQSGDAEQALSLFRSNRLAGALGALACALGGSL